MYVAGWRLAGYVAAGLGYWRLRLDAALGRYWIAEQE